MITKKLFLASSSELKEDRKEFEIFINRKNKDWVAKGVFLELVVWEDFLDAVSQTRLQDEYDKEIRNGDIFVMLFWTKVGKYTEEEFETAFGQFKATSKPFIFTYFKDAEISTASANKKDLMSLWAFQEKLSALGHFYTVYKNVDELKFKFNQQLDKLAANGFIEFNPEKELATTSPAVHIETKMTGGAAGVVGAQVVRVENLYVGAPTPPPPVVGPIPPCPYPGLAYFDPQKATQFFGREQAIQALVAAVAKRSFTALVGASGSGKSSVVLAGLAPRLSALGGWCFTYFRIGREPDKNPFAALARALEPLTGERGLADQLEEVQKLAGKLAEGSVNLPSPIATCRAKNPGKRILLIADQFEEVFTLVPDEALRNRFIDELIATFPDPGQGATPDICLVLTLRADFYNAALRYRPLADRLQDHVENLGPMTRDELREAIVKPTEAVHVEFEPGLVDTILDDVEKRPGSLPLLQFALREMWGRLKSPLMTRREYDAIGGVEGALAKRAQAILDSATDQGKDETTAALFRQLFTRLVTLGEGSEDTRRIVGRDELGPDAWALAQRLADEDNRLVVTASTTGRETAEVVHEALIRDWPTLVEWVNSDRAFLSWRNQLKARLDDWRADQADDGTLLRGGPLVVAERWIANRGDELNDEEKAFVAASIDLRKVEQQREKDDLEREQARLITIATEEARAALDQLRARLAFSVVVVWVGAAGPLMLLYYLSYTMERAGLRILSGGSPIIVAIQSLSLPTAIFFAILPRYLFTTRAFKLNATWMNYVFSGISSYIVTIILLGVTHNLNPVLPLLSPPPFFIA